MQMNLQLAYKSAPQLAAASLSKATSPSTMKRALKPHEQVLMHSQCRRPRQHTIPKFADGVHLTSAFVSAGR